MGNPPYSVGQGSANDDAANLSYPKLDERIRTTYAARTKMTNKRALYDSYIRALRWSSDRVGEAGIVAFVTNARWVDNNIADGLRECLAQDFSDIHVLHLRGNQRTSGERSRKEGGKIFGQGSRAPVAITILVKKPAATHQGRIRFHDIGDYLSREEKLAGVKHFGSIHGLTYQGKWLTILPDQNNYWLAQGDDDFASFLPLGSDAENALFETYSAGMKTNRDTWCYGPSRSALANRTAQAIDYYNSLAATYKPVGDEKAFKWCQKTLSDLASDRQYDFDNSKVVLDNFRPFSKQWLYKDSRLNWSECLTDRFFPDPDSRNRVITLSAPGFRGAFSVLMSDLLPSIHFGDMAGAQCFPR